jgi:hypothetical protein
MKEKNKMNYTTPYKSTAATKSISKNLDKLFDALQKPPEKVELTLKQYEAWVKSLIKKPMGSIFYRGIEIKKIGDK